MLRTVLSKQQTEWLREERRLLENLRVVLTGFEVKPGDMATLGRSLLQLDELFLLVVVGEFNSGKSAFINALLGQPFLAEGVTPTTTHVNVLRYGEQAGQEPTEEFVLSVIVPVDFLREINIVDTPGTNAIIRRHQEITEDFVPRSDLVLFITSADRPFTESERAFLERIRQWGKKVVIVLNKIDLFEDEAQLAQVLDFISENARGLLGFVPEVFPVSARQALRAKTSDDGDERERLWAASRFGPLEQYILGTLDEESRIRLKLLNPLGVAQRLAADYLQLANGRLGLLQEDLATIDNVEGQTDVYRQDMSREFRFRLSGIENLLYEMQDRGLAFFDETLRLARIFDLINAERIRRTFEREVVADTPQRIEAAVQGLIDWMVDKDLRQWQAVMEYLNEQRAAQHGDKIIGQVGGPFEYNRRALLDSVGRAAQTVVAGYDKEAEAKELAESVRVATALSASMGAGAMGLGTILVILLHGVVADFTGLLAAGALATLGLFVIPSKRSQARNDLRAKIEDMRAKLMASMTTQFERELERSMHRLDEAIAPYTRFVRAERDKLERGRVELEEVDTELKLLRAKVEAKRG